MKTPIQELIEHIKNNGYKNYPLSTLELIEGLELKEKQIIIDVSNKSYAKGALEMFNTVDKTDEELWDMIENTPIKTFGEQYYNETFKQ